MNSVTVLTAHPTPYITVMVHHEAALVENNTEWTLPSLIDGAAHDGMKKLAKEGKVQDGLQWSGLDPASRKGQGALFAKAEHLSRAAERARLEG